MASALVVQGLTFPARRRRPSRQAIADVIGDQPEKEFMQEVREYLELRGWRVQHQWDSTHSPAGFPDLVCLRRGHGLALECKSQHGRKPRPEQEEWIADFDAVPGFTAAVVRPSDWPWILKMAQ